MSFKEQTSTFFDELSEIVDEQKRKREEDMNVQKGGRPFSSDLTQDEEPAGQDNPAEAEVEPSVVVRRAQ